MYKFELSYNLTQPMLEENKEVRVSTNLRTNTLRDTIYAAPHFTTPVSFPQTREDLGSQIAPNQTRRSVVPPKVRLPEVFVLRVACSSFDVPENTGVESSVCSKMTNAHSGTR